MTKHRHPRTLLAGLAVLALSTALYPAAGHAAGEHGHDHDHDHDHDHEQENAPQEDHDHAGDDHEGEGHAEGLVVLSAEQIAAAGITTAPAAAGDLLREIAVPGKIVTAADRMAQIVPKAQGVVVEARKNLGDRVEKGEVMALLESREMAEAAADYMAARRAEELARTTFLREQGLWEKKITAEQDYLQARNAHQESRIRLDLSHQKLHALGHDEDMIRAYSTKNLAETLRFHEIRSPLAGRVIGRELTLGEYVDTTHRIYTIADLSIVWIEIAIAPADLPFVQEGQTVGVTGQGGETSGRLVFVSPVIDPETRSAKAIIELENSAGSWPPGAFASAMIATAAQPAGLLVPKAAVQSVGGAPAVFVRTGRGFEKRAVTTGREDRRAIEITSGLSAGEDVAVTGSFTLKAELGKSEAGHEH